MANIPKITPEQLSSGLKRVGTGVRATWSDGHGTYLLVMIALGVAAIFLRHALRPEQQYRDALIGLITDEQEPYRGETHPVLATGLLPSIVNWDLCRDANLLDETDSIAKHVSEAVRISLEDETLDTLLQPCIYSEDKSKCPKNTVGVGPAWTDSSTDSTLLVPSTVADVVRADYTASKVMLASRVIEHYARFLDYNFDSATLNSIYFIALSGALRIIPKWDENDLPAHRTFAGASYVYSTLSNEQIQCARRGHTRTLTRPYLDLAGAGVTRTLCQKVAVDRKIVGTLCFDFSPPQNILYKMLDEAAKLFDLQFVRFYNNGGVEPCSIISDCPPSLSRFSSGELADVKERWSKRYQREGAAGASAVTMLAENRYFGAIIERHLPKDRDVGWSSVVFGRVQRSSTRDIISAVMMISFTALASGLIVLGVRKKAKRLDLTLTRGLPIGVIELNNRDVIVGANDRAEEILGIELPSFGSSASSDRIKHDPRRFKDLIEEEHIVRLDDGGLLPKGPVKFVGYGDINIDRESDRSSSYYAITRGRRQLIRVSGSTFTNPEMQRHTFGTIETYVDNAHKAQVLDAFAKSKK